MSTKRKAEGHTRLTGKSHMSGDSNTDSERDSGFSDAAVPESLKDVDPTDSEGSPRSGAQRGHPTSSKQSGAGSQSPHLAVLGGSYPSLSSMILMNNVLLKQPGGNPPALKPWGLSPAVEVVPPVVQQPQVVILQPVVSHQSPSVVPKEGSGKRRHPKKYLPILKSYPKIAPHPGDSSSSSGRGSLSSSSSLSGTERGRGLPSSHLKRRYRDKQHQQRDIPGSGSSTPSLPALASPCLSPSPQPRLTLALNDSSACSSPAFSRSEFSPSPSVAPSSLSDLSHGQALSLSSLPSADREDPDDVDPQGQKRKRFCNTYNILSQSGLLDITLRTKELLRQNRRTQNDLDRLRQDASLFFQALQSGDAAVWGKLLAGQPGAEGEKEKACPEQLKGGAYQTQAKVRV